MKHKCLVLLVLLISNFLFASIDLRNQFHLGLKNKKELEKTIKSIESKTNQTTIEIGYLGASKMVYAKYLINPYNKLKSFNEGKTLLENALKADSKNIELIYLRYICSVNAPKFLNYYQNIKNDSIYLENNVKNTEDIPLKNLIISVLKK